jgi:hypothetical protein
VPWFLKPRQIPSLYRGEVSGNPFLGQLEEMFPILVCRYEDVVPTIARERVVQSPRTSRLARGHLEGDVQQQVRIRSPTGWPVCVGVELSIRGRTRDQALRVACPGVGTRWRVDGSIIHVLSHVCPRIRFRSWHSPPAGRASTRTTRSLCSVLGCLSPRSQRETANCDTPAARRAARRRSAGGLLDRGLDIVMAMATTMPSTYPYAQQEVAKLADVLPAFISRLVELGIVAPDENGTFFDGDVRRVRLMRTLDRAGLPLDFRAGRPCCDGGSTEQGLIGSPTTPAFHPCTEREVQGGDESDEPSGSTNSSGQEGERRENDNGDAHPHEE